MARQGKVDEAEAARSKFLKDAGRAAGGALIFSLPMLMTMEMWWLGFSIERSRLLLLALMSLPLLFLLSRHIGFEETRDWRDDALDTAVALGIALIVSAVVLVLFGVIEPDMTADEIIGKIVLQSMPAAIGALLARSQFSGEDDPAGREETYGGELFLMGLGALFLGFNVAPTEEMTLIAFQMTEWHAMLLVLLSLAIMHGFVFAVGFSGGHEAGPDTPWWSAFLRLTLPGYVLALGISLYLLWTFGRLDGMAPDRAIMTMVVLGFPASMGAAAARLIL